MIHIVDNVGKQNIKGMSYVLFVLHSIMFYIKRLWKVCFIIFFPNGPLSSKYSKSVLYHVCFGQEHFYNTEF